VKFSARHEELVAARAIGKALLRRRATVDATQGRTVESAAALAETTAESPLARPLQQGRCCRKLCDPVRRNSPSGLKLKAHQKLLPKMAIAGELQLRS